MSTIFQVGDEVVLHRRGKNLRGRVINVDYDRLDYTPVLCRFDGGSEYYFTADGRESAYEDVPVLSFPDGGWNYGTPPEREPKPLKFDGTITWAWVGNHPDAWKEKKRRLVIEHGWLHLYRYLCIEFERPDVSPSETDFHLSIKTDYYLYAWEIPESEIVE